MKGATTVRQKIMHTGKNCFAVSPNLNGYQAMLIVKNTIKTGISPLAVYFEHEFMPYIFLCLGHHELRILCLQWGAAYKCRGRPDDDAYIPGSNRKGDTSLSVGSRGYWVLCERGGLAMSQLGRKSAVGIACLRVCNPH